MVNEARPLAERPRRAGGFARMNGDRRSLSEAGYQVMPKPLKGVCVGVRNNFFRFSLGLISFTSRVWYSQSIIKVYAMYYKSKKFLFHSIADQ